MTCLLDCELLEVPFWASGPVLSQTWTLTASHPDLSPWTGLVGSCRSPGRTWYSWTWTSSSSACLLPPAPPLYHHHPADPGNGQGETGLPTGGLGLFMVWEICFRVSGVSSPAPRGQESPHLPGSLLQFCWEVLSHTEQKHTTQQCPGQAWLSLAWGGAHRTWPCTLFWNVPPN